MIHAQAADNARSPFRIIEQPMGREVEWVNRFLDREWVRRLAETTLRSYAMDLLHFVRWWASVNLTDTVSEGALSASVLLDYVRFQAGHPPSPRPPPSTAAWASWSVLCATSFPMRPVPSLPGFTISFGGVRRWASTVHVRHSAGCASRNPNAL